MHERISRERHTLLLAVTFRPAPFLPPIALDLVQRGDSLALELRAPTHPTEAPMPSSVEERILNALGRADRPVPAADLRAQCCVRKATFYAQLDELTISRPNRQQLRLRKLR